MSRRSERARVRPWGSVARGVLAISAVAFWAADDRTRTGAANFWAPFRPEIRILQAMPAQHRPATLPVTEVFAAFAPAPPIGGSGSGNKIRFPQFPQPRWPPISGTGSSPVWQEA